MSFMAFSNLKLLFGLCLVTLIASEVNGTEIRSNSYNLYVNQAIDDAIKRFDEAQKLKMAQGFTSNAKRSYKKTKHSLAMETRNAIFKDAVLSLQIAFPDVKESNLTNDVLKNLPSHFDAFGAKTFKERTTNMNVQKRDLDTACHGFPLHLPGHVQPCRDEEKIECNEKDEKIRRINGECNNLQDGKRSWGAQVRPLERILPRNNEKFQTPLHDVAQNINAEKRGKRETEECKLPSRIALKSFHNKYLRVESNGRVKAKSEVVLAWEMFEVIEVNKARNEIGLKMKLGGDGATKFVGSFHQGGWLYTTDKLQGWERFTVECLGENKIALKSFHRKYIGATPDGHLFGANKRQAWETWTFEAVADNQDGWFNTNTGEYKLFNVDYGDDCSKEDGCTWYESKQICEQEGGYLVKITDQEENDMIEEIIDGLNPNGNKFLFHLGLNDIETEGVWKWTSDNSKMTFDNFYRGEWTEPNSVGDEDCSMMFSWGHESNGKWADVGCDATVVLDRKMIPLCERTPNQCPSECQTTETSECQDATVSLPNARFASSVLHTDLDDPEVKVTALLMQFAQFLDHDISLSPEASTTNCCKNPNQEDCMPIMIPENDAYFRQIHNQTCMQFTRSVPYCPETADSCVKRENMNVITSILDTSNVYGSDDQTARCLRSWVDGKLLVDENKLLPTAGATAGGFGVQAGDARAPEMPALSAMHALWMREHNRICDLIKLKKPDLDGMGSDQIDEYIYQNARRILNAEFQNVVYAEQIPIVEGPSSIAKFNLGLNVDGSTYNPNSNPSVLAEFSGASNRYGHSLVQGLVDVHNTDLSYSHSYRLADNFFNPSEYNGNGFDKIMAGLTQQKSQKFDRLMSTELTQRMFHGIVTPPGADYGLDLAALNIQRGRDIGLPTYYEMYQLFGPNTDPHKDMSCWARKPETFTDENWNRLKTVYKHPRDIDLFSGGLMEKRRPGEGLLGLVFATINSMQFSRLKDGDRFFFTHTNGAAKFDRNGREAIMARKISDIICDNTAIISVPTFAFLEQNPITNPLIDCGDHTPLDLNKINLIDV